MSFLSRISGVLRQTASKHMNMELSASNISLYQAFRSMSSSKLFIGGISYNTDEMSLREAFSQHGEVIEARIITDRETGRSRGFGFVTYTSSDEASNAIQALDGQDLHGRRIRVNYATDRSRGGGYRGGFDNEGGGGYGSYGNNSYGGTGGYGNNNPRGGGGYGDGSHGRGAGGGGYGDSNYGRGADYSSSYSNSGVSNYDSGASSFGGTHVGGSGASGDYFHGGVSNDGDSPSAAYEDFGDNMVDGNKPDDDNEPENFANTRG